MSIQKGVTSFINTFVAQTNEKAKEAEKPAEVPKIRFTVATPLKSQDYADRITQREIKQAEI